MGDQDGVIVSFASLAVFKCGDTCGVKDCLTCTVVELAAVESDMDVGTVVIAEKWTPWEESNGLSGALGVVEGAGEA